MKLYCTACDQHLGSAAELCGHRNPLGFCCCYSEHGPADWNDDENEVDVA